MKTLFEKLNYRGQKRIAVINGEGKFDSDSLQDLKDVIVDKEIDQRFPYDFMIIFVKKASEVEHYTPIALHNLVVDGVLWFCYPKKSSGRFKSEIDRDHGWKALYNLDFYGVRLVSIDEDWSAMRFRNKKFIKSTSGRFSSER